MTGQPTGGGSNKPLVSGRVLHESGLVAETVTAVLAHAVEMRLVFPVAAVRVMAVLVEPVPQVSLGDRLVLEYAHRVLDAGLAHLRAHVPRRRRRPVVLLLRRRRRRMMVVPGRRRPLATAAAAAVQQPVGQHGLVMVESGRRCEHQTCSDEKETFERDPDEVFAVVATYRSATSTSLGSRAA